MHELVTGSDSRLNETKNENTYCHHGILMPACPDATHSFGSARPVLASSGLIETIRKLSVYLHDLISVLCLKVAC